MALAYGAWGEKLVDGEVREGIVRSTVVLDPEGKVTLAQYQVKAQGHVQALKRTARRLTPDAPSLSAALPPTLSQLSQLKTKRSCMNCRSVSV